jgi:sodium-dependent phosphate cotransporter
MTGFLYLLFTFFVIPFSLIYLSKGSIDVRELTYDKEDGLTHKKATYKTIVRTYKGQQFGSALGDTPVAPFKVVSVHRRGNILIFNNDLYELNKAGFCRDGEDENGKYKSCIDTVLPSLKLTSGLTIDSVYVFEKKWYDAARVDSVSVYSYISATENVLVKRVTKSKAGAVISTEELRQIEKK